MNTPLLRLFLVLVIPLPLACSNPDIKGSGPGNGGNSGSNGGGAGGSPGGGGSSPTDAPSLGGVVYPEAGAANPPGSDAGASSGPTCAAEAIEGKLVPLDLMLLVDISGSMEESAGTQSKWVAMRDAFELFLKDPKSVGLGVGLMTFPPPAKKCAGAGDCGAGVGTICEQKGMCSAPALVATTEGACNTLGAGCPPGDPNPCTLYGICTRSGLRCSGLNQACGGGMAGDMCMPRPKFCTGDESCGAALYATPIVGIADLPAAQPALSTAFAAIVPQGGTPTTPAVRGALDQLRARAMANPDRKPVLVLATDGLPTGCFPNSSASVATALTAARTGAPSVLTYVIGVFQQAQLVRSQPALNEMATAGGTGMPFVLTTGADLSMRFLDAISQIRGTALGCEFTIPRPTMGTIDFDKVNVRYNATAGAEDLRYVESMDRCDPVRGGWYYDVKPPMGTPTRVRLCPVTCDKVKAGMGGSVQLRFGCKTIIE